MVARRNVGQGRSLAFYRRFLLVSIFFLVVAGFSLRNISDLSAEKSTTPPKPQEVTEPAATTKKTEEVTKPAEPAAPGHSEAVPKNLVSVKSEEAVRSTVIMKVIAANPSRQKPQSIEVKSYLPAEIKPVNVVNSGGLEVLFDKDKSCYYLYKKEVMLEPAQIQPFIVELQDVWFIPQKDIDTLMTRTNELLDKVKKIPYNCEEGKVIAGRILKKLDEINRSQEKDETLPLKTKIPLYRKNKDGMKEAREDLEKLNNLTREKKEKTEDKKKKT